MMEYRKCNDREISLLGFGCMRFPVSRGHIDVAKTEAMIDYAVECGVNYFDTAYVYHGGKSESILGDALRKYPRESINIATKMPLSPKYLDNAEQVFATQLKRLKTGYFDFYLCHNMNQETFRSFEKFRIFEFLKQKQEQGYIKNLGFSFHDSPKLLKHIVSNYDFDFAQIQLNYMDYTFQKAKEQYETLTDSGLPISVMEPVRGGALAVLCDESAQILKWANPVVSVASWAIRYAMTFPNVMTVLSGMTDMDQVIDNCRTAANFIPISTDEQTVIDAALKVYAKSGTIPCTGCNYCGECPKGIQIPHLIAIYNAYIRQNRTEQNRTDSSESVTMFSGRILKFASIADRVLRNVRRR
ncbi:oxidoreductase [Clostridia bacterium]|nr:oxidoreductase [Clostridia bacterium]